MQTAFPRILAHKSSIAQHGGRDKAHETTAFMVANTFAAARAHAHHTRLVKTRCRARIFIAVPRIDKSGSCARFRRFWRRAVAGGGYELAGQANIDVTC